MDTLIASFPVNTSIPTPATSSWPRLTFNPKLTCSHPMVIGLGDTILANYPSVEEAARLRAVKRRRLYVTSAHRLAILELVVRAIAANITLAALLNEVLAITLRNTRQLKALRLGGPYDWPGNARLQEVLETLSLPNTPLFTLVKSRQKGWPSTITPTIDFVAAARSCGITATDFNQMKGNNLK